MIRFTKYHGCGNNFIIVRESDVDGMDYSQLALDMCNVNTGIGADGFIVVREDPALEMVFYNMDGSRAPMCGNGIRCFAAYCYDNDICKKEEYPVETLAGTMVVKIISTDPFMVRIWADLCSIRNLSESLTVQMNSQTGLCIHPKEISGRAAALWERYIQ